MNSEIVDKGSIMRNAVGNCPEAIVELEGREVRCLLDTGAQVSTVTESWYRQGELGWEL